MLDKILRRPEVEQCTGLSRSAIYLNMDRGAFPKSIPLGAKSVGWLESEIKAWQEARIAARDQPKEKRCSSRR